MRTNIPELPDDKSQQEESETNGKELVEEFGDEQVQTSSLTIVKENVSDFDVFLLAKNILAIVGLLFFIIAMCRIFCDDNKGVTEVWEYSKVALNSIASLVLGLYFGKKK